MPRVPSLLLLLLPLVAASCAGARPAETRADVHAAVPDLLAVAPPSGIDGEIGRELWFALARHVTAQGFELTRDPGAAELLLQLEARRAKGGLGHEAELAEARAAVHTALARRFGAQAVLHAAVVPRRARFEDGVARWDGREEPISGSAHDVHTRVDGYRGLVDAWSVRVWVEDQAGAVLAEGYGGVVLAEHVTAGRWARSVPRPPLDETAPLLAAAERAVGTLPRPR